MTTDRGPDPATLQHIARIAPGLDPGARPAAARQAEWMRPRSLLSRLCSALALIMLALTAIILIAKRVIAPLPGEWSTALRIGPATVTVGVPTLMRLATASWVGPHLDGRRIATRHGVVQMRWQGTDRTLVLHCAPCSAQLPALGSSPVAVAGLTLQVRRDFEELTGTLEAVGAAPASPRVAATWSGRLSQTALALEVDVPDTAVAQWFAVLAPQLPELRHAQVEGVLGLRVQARFPAAEVTVQPRLAGLRVGGLGTDAWAHARSGCGPSAGLRNDAWLARAVIAAEDQKFFNHPGYDLEETLVALDTNQAHGQVARGGSTLTQQLAKLLVAGSDRTLERKLRELLYAVEMETTLGKTRILQLYLDNAPWGSDGLCGAEAAARHYFGRSARTLSPAQAVWLAAMLRNPGHAARQWAASGKIDKPRAMWVAEGVRGVPGVEGRRRAAFLREVAATDWPLRESAPGR